MPAKVAIELNFKELSLAASAVDALLGRWEELSLPDDQCKLLASMRERFENARGLVDRP